MKETQIEDTYTPAVEYKEICAQAAVDDETFSKFKSMPKYRSMLEHANVSQAQEHLEDIQIQTPKLMSYFDKFRTNDTVGNPVTVDFNKGFEGSISPTTIQYARVLSDLITYFDNMDGFKIVEIGAAYGGQCKIISDYVNFKEYICFEMTEPSRLVRKYVDHFNIENVVSLDAYEFYDKPYNIDCDLIISCFAFCEQSKHFQDCYLKHIINSAPRGYLWCNETPESYGIEGLKNLLPHKLNEKNDIPSERNTNRILWWTPKEKEFFTWKN